jgi:hypothetical protein
MHRRILSPSLSVLAALALTCGAALAANMPRAASPHARAANRSSSVARPLLTVSGYKLKWTRVPGASSYLLATIVQPNTKRTTTRLIKGRTFAPPKRWGQTVDYRLRANLQGAPWTKNVSITWARLATTARLTNVAPVLKVSGGRLYWSAQSAAKSFKGAISTAPSGSANRITTYQNLGSVTSWSPTPQPGHTLYYDVASEGTAGERWATPEIAISWPAAAVVVTNAAPAVTLSGGTISWSAQSAATGFRASISTGPSGSSTRTTTYQTLGSVTSWSPTPQPGQTVYYDVASEGAAGDQWATEVSISWPAATPPPPPPSPSGALRVAVMNQTGLRLNSMMTSIGVNWDRIDVGDGSDISEVRYGLTQGVKSLVLYNPGLAGMAPSTAAAQVKALAQKIVPLGLSEIEFGNEVFSNGSTPQSYAAQYAAAHAAVAGMGVTLIANSDGDYQRTDGTWSQDAAGGGWIHDFLAALPAPGASQVDAFSVHPYGPMGSLTDGEDMGWQEVPRYHDLAVQYGANVPWYVTEVGHCIGGSGCFSQTDSHSQAADITQYLNDVTTKYTWVKFVAWYQLKDDSTGQWGLLNADNSPRPSFTALSQWMAANAPTTNG